MSSWTWIRATLGFQWVLWTVPFCGRMIVQHLSLIEKKPLRIWYTSTFWVFSNQHGVKNVHSTQLNASFQDSPWPNAFGSLQQPSDRILVWFLTPLLCIIDCRSIQFKCTKDCRDACGFQMQPPISPTSQHQWLYCFHCGVTQVPGYHHIQEPEVGGEHYGHH